MHCALLKHRHMALSAPLVDAARGSAQRPNLVPLYTSTVVPDSCTTVQYHVVQLYRYCGRILLHVPVCGMYTSIDSTAVLVSTGTAGTAVY